MDTDEFEEGKVFVDTEGDYCLITSIDPPIDEEDDYEEGTVCFVYGDEEKMRKALFDNDYKNSLEREDYSFCSLESQFDEGCARWVTLEPLEIKEWRGII